ncbi:MAG TPA: hypothetical protein VN673_03300 [Clostridia bacterium]|nr:hypothetical protein [Clostridia bacterium]
MRKFAFILGIVLVAAVLVAAGYWLGFGNRSMAEAYSVTALDKALTDASWRARILHYLDSGNVEAAQSLLRSRLDSDIVTIWAFGDYSDVRSRRMATNVLAGIAAFRAEYPSNYMSRTSDDEIDAKIASILERARKAETK